MKRLITIISVCVLVAFLTLHWSRQRAIEAEVLIMLHNILQGELTYKAENDTYMNLPSNPAKWLPGPGAKEPIPWDKGTAFDDIYFAPAAQVRHQFSVTVSEDGKSFCITAIGDLDEDGEVAIYRITSDNYAVVKAGDDF